ncbi:hypothetical protein SDIAM26S_05885 [Streptomyces diastaticus subsp. diastaticus]
MDGTRGTGSSTGRRRLVLVACVFVVLPALVGGLVLWYQVSAHGTAAPGHRIVPGADMAARLLMAAAVVLGASHAAGRLAVLLGQPPVIGEICAGILLGPSLLGRAAPQLWARLFPEGILPMLDGLAQLGLVFFMFKVGRDLSSVRLRALGGRTLLVSLASLAVPFAGGAVAAVALADGHAGPGPVAFTVFLGCALGITAFPVLARILSELGLSHTAVGRTSLLAAAIGDAGAWLLLATAVAAGRPCGLLRTGDRPDGRGDRGGRRPPRSAAAGTPPGAVPAVREQRRGRRRRAPRAPPGLRRLRLSSDHLGGRTARGDRRLPRRCRPAGPGAAPSPRRPIASGPSPPGS